MTNVYGRYKNEEFGEKIKDIINEYCGQISKEYPNNDYSIKTAAKALFYIDKFEEAIHLVNNFHEPSHFMLRWKAYSELCCKREECVVTAEKVVQLNEEDTRAKKYLSSNYALLSDCYEFKNDIKKCIEYLDKAISICEDAKYKRQLEEKLQKIQII